MQVTDSLKQAGKMKQKYTHLIFVLIFHATARFAFSQPCPPIPTDFRNGVVVSNGEQAYYWCTDDNYAIVGPAIRACEEGVWSEEEPYCAYYGLCSFLRHPIDGNVTVNTYNDSGIATYTCNSGYEVSGSVSRTCSNGRWSGIDSICKRIVCPHLFKPGNGAVSVISNFIDGIASYSCDQNYNLVGSPQQICQESGVWSEFPPICTRLSPKIRVDATAEIQIGFEQLNIDVPEGAGTVDICVAVLHTITSNVNIPSITLELSALDYGDAVLSKDFTQVPNAFRQLVLNGAHQRVCYPQEIMDDNIPENDEKFTLILRLISRDSVSASVSLLPSVVVVRILDDDGLAIVGFEESTIGMKEDIRYGSVCVTSRFKRNTKAEFTLLVNSYPATADSGIDYQNVESIRIGPLNALSPQYCFQVTIIADSVIEQTETFILKLSLENDQTDVIIEPTHDTLIVKIIDDDESNLPGLLPCDSYLRVLFPGWFKHCYTCTYPIEWSTWTDKPNGNIAMPKSLCPSGKGSIKVHHKIAPEEGCDPKVEYGHYCTPTQTEQLIQNLGLGSQPTVQSVSTIPTPIPTTSNSPIQGRRKRSSHNNHCYDASSPRVLSTVECQTQDTCPYSGPPKARENMSCQNRSILFLIDSSGSIDKDVYKNITDSVGIIGRTTCGDTKFALLKFDSETYLEFCFDCYNHSHNGRESLIKRVFETGYTGGLTHTGAAVSCAGNFVLKEDCGFRMSENRCIDIVIFTDGQSNGPYNVCKQIECLHKSPLASLLRIHAIGVGAAVSEELSCIREYATTDAEGDSFLEFKNLTLLVNTLNGFKSDILEGIAWSNFDVEPKYDCVSWINGTLKKDKNFIIFKNN